MTTVNTALPTNFGPGMDSAGLDPTASPTGPNGGVSLSMLRFEHALAKAEVQNASFQTVDPAEKAQNIDSLARPDGFVLAQSAPSGPSGATPEVSGITPTETDRTRALRGLDLSNDVASADGPTTGEGIIDGLSRLRGVFDAQENAITGISDTSSAGTGLTNSSDLINLQLEVVKYSLLMDVTSKLAGKSTQTFDTLMKGQ